MSFIKNDKNKNINNIVEDQTKIYQYADPLRLPNNNILIKIYKVYNIYKTSKNGTSAIKYANPLKLQNINILCF